MDDALPREPSVVEGNELGGVVVDESALLQLCELDEAVPEHDIKLPLSLNTCSRNFSLGLSSDSESQVELLLFLGSNPV